ncbi:MAG: M17 family peptidase N-terminal domain-containing protein, partial [Verrucomicrobiota bacterium]|nr:M17 family peptidase N-terminal domain-containing protein [Verrucomicrobiota bacterium]
MLELRKIDITEQQIETLLILVTEDDVNLYSDNILNKLAKEAKGYNEFNGEKNEELILYPKDNIKRLFFVGIGKMSDLKTEDFRNILGQTVGKMKKIRLSNLTVAIPDTNISEIVREMYIDAMMEGAFLANYSFDKYKNEVKIKSLQKIIFIGSQKIAEKYRKLPKQIEHICSAVCKARDWVSIPSNEKTPELFSKMIIKEAEETDIRITLMEEKELRSKGFGALLAVGQGSSNSSCLMIMHYKPK